MTRWAITQRRAKICPIVRADTKARNHVPCRRNLPVQTKFTGYSKVKPPRVPGQALGSAVRRCVRTRYTYRRSP
eukprot:7388121-Prymnesium_polylepis.1